MQLSVIMPCLNEVDWIERSVRSLSRSAQAYDHEIIVLDGGSTDGTLATLEGLSAEIPRLRVVHNPERLQAAAVNLGAQIAEPSSTILLRADCHAVYPDDFVAQCVETLRERGAVSVVVPLVAVGKEPRQAAIAAAQNSLFGNGGSRHRSVGRAGVVDHGHHAAFDRSFFQAVGGYDPAFSHNEDAELDIRIGHAGGRIWLHPDAAIEYLPRRGLRSLARQYFNHGRGRARTISKHRRVPKLRQLMPLAIALGSVFGLVGGLLWFAPLLALPIAYFGLILAVGVGKALEARSVSMLLVAPALAAMHFAWAAGFLRGLRLYAFSRPGDPRMPLGASRKS